MKSAMRSMSVVNEHASTRVHQPACFQGAVRAPLMSSVPTRTTPSHYLPAHECIFPFLHLCAHVQEWEKEGVDCNYRKL